MKNKCFTDVIMIDQSMPWITLKFRSRPGQIMSSLQLPGWQQSPLHFSSRGPMVTPNSFLQEVLLSWPTVTLWCTHWSCSKLTKHVQIMATLLENYSQTQQHSSNILKTSWLKLRATCMFGQKHVGVPFLVGNPLGFSYVWSAKEE